ncbi:glycosyltransferase family 2 protein [uncultured Jatrophihabitans sp.]|uniref:glycosyltransferase family 2 protein n=1 Tax=uncultured Jatrophihabitans sp. TaxID=1610747 RepID=UPI0035CAA354
MRLVLTLLVRDEVDVVAAMIEHHLAAGVDFIVATDNGSQDGTVEVLADYENAGVLQLLHEPEQNYAQAQWVTRMARLAAAEHGADWVINADADEFWWPRDGTSLTNALAVLPARYGTVPAPRENLVADPHRSGAWPNRLVVRDLLSLHQRGGRIGNKVAHRADPDIEVRQGNHELRGARLGETWPAQPITVLHVPDRSYEQFAHKIEIGGRSLAANPDLTSTFGWHWRADHDRLLDGTLERAWRTRQLTADSLLDGLQRGRLVPDERIARRLEELRDTALRPEQLAAVLDGSSVRRAD